MKYFLKSFLPLFYFHLAAIVMAVFYQNCTGGFERKPAAIKSEHLPYQGIEIIEERTSTDTIVSE